MQTTSKLSSSKARRSSACPTSNLAAAPRERAMWMRSSSGSMPATAPFVPTRSAIPCAKRPVPHPTSRTRAPSVSPSRSTRRLPPSNWRSLTRSYVSARCRLSCVNEVVLSARALTGSGLPCVDARQRARDEQRHRGEAEAEGDGVQGAPRLEVSNAQEQRVGDGEVEQRIQNVHARR